MHRRKGFTHYSIGLFNFAGIKMFKSACRPLPLYRQMLAFSSSEKLFQLNYCSKLWNVLWKKRLRNGNSVSLWFRKWKKNSKRVGYERFEMMLVILGSRRMFLIYPNYPWICIIFHIASKLTKMETTDCFLKVVECSLHLSNWRIF